MKIQLFTLLAVVAAAFARPQGDPSPSVTEAPSSEGGITETFPTIVSDTTALSIPSLPPVLTTSSGSDIPIISSAPATGNSTSVASSQITSRPTSLSASTSRAQASTSTFSTATGAASSGRSASVPLAVVACILGASQMF